MTLEPRSKGTIYMGCDRWQSAIIETGGPKIAAITNSNQVDYGNRMSFSCTSNGHIIELINDNDVSVDVTYYTRTSTPFRVLAASMWIIITISISSYIINEWRRY